MPNVSRETLEMLDWYAAHLTKWNRTINLVSRSTLDDVQGRHFEDSSQLFDYRGIASSWVDLGSGAGFPALVLAIHAKSDAPDLRFTLVESDKRKAAFCASVIRDLDLNAQMVCSRIEALGGLAADIVSARALAPLDVLLGYARTHLQPSGWALFPKGARWREEVDVALASWRFSFESIPSKTDPSAVILKIGDISRV